VKVLTSITIEDVLRWGWVAPGVALVAWDAEAAHAIAARQVKLVRDAGALAQLPLYLTQLGLARTWFGDFEGAESGIAESDGVAAATGSQFTPYASLWLMGCGQAGDLAHLRPVDGDEGAA
jgi:hypothetical protein